MPARDAFRLLAKLASRPDLFDAVEADAARAADFLIRKQLSSGGLTPARLRALHDAVGGDALSRSVSRLSKTAATEIVKRLDRANPACRGAPTGIDPCWARARILALAGGAARPVVARKAEARPDAPSAAALSAALAAAL